MNRVEITVRNLQKKIPVSPKEIKKAVCNTLFREGFKGCADITVCVVNDKQIREFNLYYLGRDTTTDCLAFDMSLPHKRDKLLADIIISSDTALKNSRLYKTSALFELNLYAIHGTLHLLGYDDATPRSRKEMYKKAIRILKNVNT